MYKINWSFLFECLRQSTFCKVKYILWSFAEKTDAPKHQTLFCTPWKVPQSRLVFSRWGLNCLYFKPDKNVYTWIITFSRSYFFNVTKCFRSSENCCHLRIVPPSLKQKRRCFRECWAALLHKKSYAKWETVTKVLEKTAWNVQSRIIGNFCKMILRCFSHMKCPVSSDKSVFFFLFYLKQMNVNLAMFSYTGYSTNCSSLEIWSLVNETKRLMLCCVNQYQQQTWDEILY